MCKDITFEGVTSSSDATLPTGISFFAPSQTDGNGVTVTYPTFQTTNVDSAATLATYNVNLKMTVTGGATKYQPLTLQVTYNCIYDVISLNKTMPLNHEPLFSYYQNVNGVPVLVID